MPILRYFVFVGGALLALLFAANFALPQAPVGESIVTSSNDVPLIRIRSDRKLPERVVLDTSQPAVVPPAAVTMAAVVAPQPPAQASTSPALSELSAKARVRDTFAQFGPTDPKGDVASVKTAEAKPVVPAQPKRKVARRSAPTYYYYGQPMFGRPMRVAQQPHFGFFNTTW
jgi:hypothetical protein